jgi:hypothetical protein
MCLQNESSATPAQAASDSLDASANGMDDTGRAVDDLAAHFTMGTTVTIFDWDDTLLCTSFLQANEAKLEGVPAGMRCYISTLGGRVRKLLELSMAAGHVFIITNASQGWVEESAARYLPEVEPLLPLVSIVSARAFEAQFPGEMHLWKRAAFLDLQNKFDMQPVKSLIILGDSEFEMEAAHALGRALSVAPADSIKTTMETGCVLVKAVKFRSRPSPQMLGKELDLVAQKYPKILASKRSLNIAFEKI